MTMYLLDTETAGQIISGASPGLREHLRSVPMYELAISVVTEGELSYGVAKRGVPKDLNKRVQEFLERVDVLAWTEDVARIYGGLRAACEAAGVVVSPLDMMVAAHAKAIDAVLITRNPVFKLFPDSIKLDDWSK